MNCRRHGGKPTLALWTLVAATDLAVRVAASGVLVLVWILAALAVVAGGLVAGRAALRRPVRAALSARPALAARPALPTRAARPALGDPRRRREAPARIA